MKELNKIISRFMWMFLACLIFSACSEDEKWEDAIEEGLPVSLKFDITTPAPHEIQTRATDEQETNVEKLALFFYKDESTLPLAYEVPKEELATHTGTSTNYKYSISVPESVGLTSGTWYLYAVANWDKGFWDSSITYEQLKAMNKAEMDNFCILKQYKTLDITETAILLSGKYGDTTGEVLLKVGPNTLDKAIHLKRSIAKIIFNFIDGNNGPAKFTPRTYEIHNYCRTSTLFERDGWNSKNPGDPAGLEWVGATASTGQEIFSDGTDFPIVGKTLTFYMPENVQKARKTIDNQLMREHRGADGKFTNAPENATYIVVHGDYEGPLSKDNPEKVTATVHYTILLGDFSSKGNVNNYSTRRNTKYTYNVTVNGVNNIYVEAIRKGENQPGAEGDIIKESSVLWPIVLDAHYETRILKIALKQVKGKDDYGLILKTPYSNYSSNGTSGGTAPKLDLDWVEFCKPASKDQWAKYPGKGNCMNLKTLLTKFHGIKENDLNTYKDDFIVQQDTDGKYYVYVQVFVNEYFYENKPLNTFINAASRELTISSSTDVSTDGNSTYTGDPLFAISQKSIKSMYDMNAENPFGIETFEDEKETIIAADRADGKYGADKDHGHQNFFKNFPTAEDGKLHWSTFVNYKTNTLNDGYNYGIYQGLLRNRDLNANDIIDPEEMRWFIPSVNQHIAIWNGYHALEDEVHLDNGPLYYTSTNGQYRTMWAKEGAFGAYKSGDNGGKELVRCIRALKNISDKTSRSTEFSSRTNIFTVCNFMANAVRPSGSQKGEYIYHSQNSKENKLPSAFKMAKQDLEISEGGTDDKPGDKFVPEVQLLNYEPITEQPNDKEVRHELNLKINNPNNHSFYTNTTASLKGATPIKNVNGFVGIVKGQGISDFLDTNAIEDIQTLYILADNGNYVQVTNTKEFVSFGKYTYGVKVNDPVIIDKNQPVPGKPATSKKSTFTLDEITTQNICADYFEEPDGSDKGKWRVPNQRELMIMFMYSKNADHKGSTYSLSEATATRTYYDERGPKTGMFFIQLGGKFITSQNDKKISGFKIRPVRDVNPASLKPTSSSSDSSYQSGGSIIK